MEALSTTCDLCGQSHPGSIYYGDMLRKDDIAVHQFCLLFSNKLYADEDKDDKVENALETYDLARVKEYINKTEKHRCIFCNENRATIHCRMKTCNRRFHYKCGFDSEKCLFKFDDLFYAFCPAHSAKPKTKPTEADSCVVCLCEIGPHFTPFGSISLNCKPYLWMHRECAIQLAAYRGYEFQCPICADKKAFQKYVCLRGVFIPKRDTLTQAHNVAYQETQTKYCEAEVCLYAKGDAIREPRAEEKLLCPEVETAKCGYCGKNFHTDCALKQGTYKEAVEGEGSQKAFICCSCMNLSDHDLSVSSISSDENELNAGFDYGSDCSSITVVQTSQLKKGQEDEGIDSETQLAKRFKFEHHYQWQPCHGYHNTVWRQFKLNLFMNTLRCGVKRKGGPDDS